MSGRTIGASDNPALLGGMKAKNNGRYNGNGREWRTPPEVYAPLHAEFQFTLDPCSTDANALTPRHFTERENGLEQDWGSERVFMNPPYGAEVYAWTAKARTAAASGALVVGLLPASTDLRWWHEDVVAAGAEVRYIRGRVRFLTDGPYRASGFFASVVVVWRPPLIPASEGLRGHETCVPHDHVEPDAERWEREQARALAEARRPDPMFDNGAADGPNREGRSADGAGARHGAPVVQRDAAADGGSTPLPPTTRDDATAGPRAPGVAVRAPGDGGTSDSRQSGSRTGPGGVRPTALGLEPIPDTPSLRPTGPGWEVRPGEDGPDTPSLREALESIIGIASVHAAMAKQRGVRDAFSFIEATARAALDPEAEAERTIEGFGPQIVRGMP